MSGERMIWAAAYAAALERNGSPIGSAAWACGVVERLRKHVADGDLAVLTEDARAMVTDMLSNGGDR